jgi:PAS domain S-box-containing protein
MLKKSMSILRGLRRWLFGQSITVLLTGVVLLAGLPAIAVIVTSSFEGRRQAEMQALEEMRNLVHSLAAIQEGINTQAQVMLTALAHTEEVRTRDLAACNRLFTALLAEHPEMSNIFLTNKAGRVVATGLPAFLGIDLSDRGYFREAMASRGVGISDFILGRASHKPILAFALADTDTGDGLAGVIGLSYYLEGYELFLQKLELPSHARVTLLDRDGLRMVAHPMIAAFPLGKQATRHLWERCLTSEADQGYFIDDRWTGEQGLFTFARLRLAPDRPPYMTILTSSNRREVFQGADSLLRRGLTSALVAMLLALIIARIAGQAAVVRGISTLADAAGRLSGGDLSARVQAGDGCLEVRRLGESFNVMADALQQHEQELAQAVEALGKMRSMLNNILESMPSAIIGLDGAGRVTHVNGPATHLFGLDKEEAMGRAAVDSLPLLAGHMQNVETALRERRALTVEKLVLPGDDDAHCMDMLFYPLIANGAEGVVIRFDDVTDRERALEEKNILLKEIHHRVKNNLQIILSFIGLQAEDAADPAERDRLRRLELRIRSMALVHQQLYSHGDVATIEMAQYLKTLAEGVLAIFPELSPRPRLVCRLEPFRLSLDKAVPCGLLVGELLTNACKHAFLGEAAGTIRMECRLEAGLARVAVEDDGQGLPPGFDYNGAITMGLTLVKELVRQLQGQTVLSQPDGGGLRFAVAFPIQREDADNGDDPFQQPSCGRA